MKFHQRLKELRKKKGLSQNELGDITSIHFTQISRYERGDTTPNAEVLTKLAKALDTTVDYLMNGTTTDVVAQAGLDKELISRFQSLQSMNKEDRKTVLALIDAFIAKNRIEQILK